MPATNGSRISRSRTIAAMTTASRAIQNARGRVTPECPLPKFVMDRSSLCHELRKQRALEGISLELNHRGTIDAPDVPLAPPLPACGRAIAYASQLSRLSSRAQRSTKWCAADPGPKYPGIRKKGHRRGYLHPGSRCARPG